MHMRQGLGSKYESLRGLQSHPMGTHVEPRISLGYKGTRLDGHSVLWDWLFPQEADRY